MEHPMADKRHTEFSSDLPLRVEEYTKYKSHVIDSKGHVLFAFSSDYEKDKQYAALIVQAVNSHAALTEAVEELVKHFIYSPFSEEEVKEMITEPIYNKITKALALAKKVDENDDTG